MDDFLLEFINKLNNNLIPLPEEYWNADFFPEYSWYFVVMTDDEKIMFCSRVQENGKAIHTAQNNNLISDYFRRRLGLPNSALITKEDLFRYGRTDVTFYKIDDETYYMDFSVS